MLSHKFPEIKLVKRPQAEKYCQAHNLSVYLQPIWRKYKGQKIGGSVTHHEKKFILE